MGRLCARARQWLQPHTASEKKYFRNRSRRAQRLARQIAQKLRGKHGQKNLKNKAKSSIVNWLIWLKRFWSKFNGWRLVCANGVTQARWLWQSF
jgi:hypothetical protein